MVDPARTAIRQLELLRMEQVQTEEMQQVADILVAHADALRMAREETQNVATERKAAESKHMSTLEELAAMRDKYTEVVSAKAILEEAMKSKELHESTLAKAHAEHVLTIASLEAAKTAELAAKEAELWAAKEAVAVEGAAALAKAHEHHAATMATLESAKAAELEAKEKELMVANDLALVALAAKEAAYASTLVDSQEAVRVAREEAYMATQEAKMLRSQKKEFMSSLLSLNGTSPNDATDSSETGGPIPVLGVGGSKMDTIEDLQQTLRAKQEELLVTPKKQRKEIKAEIESIERCGSVPLS